MPDFIKRLTGWQNSTCEPARNLDIPPPEVPGSKRPHILWADQYDVPARRLRCPNCDGLAPKPPRLTVRYATPERPMRFARVMHCPECKCDFYEQQKPPDYAEEKLLQRGRVPFYLQQGAGIASLTAPLVRSGKKAGAKYLDVGCGFGFALDFASRTLQWRAQGIDPSPMAALGREMLGVAIEQRYLGDDEPAYEAAFDVVMAAETIEHVPSPIGFLRTLRRLLRVGGLLILTTPDAADIRPETAPGALAALLSPGFHLILQTRESLEALLHKAGFDQVTIEKDGYSLVAYASDQQFSLEVNRDRFRTTYLEYLTRRMRNFPPGQDLLLGFAGRALQEAVNSADIPAASECWHLLRDASLTRFGIDLETIDELPAEASSCTLERLATIIPLSLGGLLYADTMRRMAGQPPSPACERRLLCAADAADTLRRAAAELIMEDSLSEELAWVARAEAVLCAAVAGDQDDAIARLQKMPTFPGRAEECRHRFRERVLVALVNAGRFSAGATLAQRTGLQQARWSFPGPEMNPAMLDELERGVVFCLAVLDMQGTDLDTVARALRRFALVRRQIAAPDIDNSSRQLYWGAVRGEMQALERLGFADRIAPLLAAVRSEAGEPPDDILKDVTAAFQGAPAQDYLVVRVNAGRYDAGRLLADYLYDCGFVDPPPGALNARERDRLFSLAVLDAQPGGDPNQAGRRFATVRASLLQSRAGGENVSNLYWAALRGELETRVSATEEAARVALVRQAVVDIGVARNDVPEDLRSLLQSERGGVPA
jgi:SAM-dependent methyltransferase